MTAIAFATLAFERGLGAIASTFISRIVAWCTSRSMAASVMVLSVKILPHSPNGWLAVIRGALPVYR